MLKLEVLPNEEASVLQWLQGVNVDRNPFTKLFIGRLATELAEHIKGIGKVEDITKVIQRLSDMDMFPERLDEELVEYFSKMVLEFTYEEVLGREEKRAMKILTKAERKAANRARYLPYPVWFWEKALTNGKARFRYTRDLRSKGLLECIMEHLHGQQEAPITMALLCKTDEGSHGAMMRMREAGYVTSGQRLLFRQDSQAFKYVVKALPTAIAAAGYAHGLAAPIQPDTYMPDISMTFRRIEINGQDLETDGSGIYHPDAPEVAELVKKYGPVAWQIRALNPTLGVFVKGVVFPSEHALDDTGNPAIVADWNMIKGAWKSLALERRATGAVKTMAGMHAGALQVWHKPFPLSMTFEGLECMKCNPETKALVKNLVHKSLKRLRAMGIEGLAAQVAKKDRTLALVGQLMTAMGDMGLKLSPMMVPRWRAAIMQRMNNELWKTAVGAGIRSKAYIARLDSQVPPGFAVVAGMEPGHEVAAYRFPLILDQALKNLTTMVPLPHHLVDGKMAPFTVICNPHDLTLGMQGDDDGDFIGISDDPDVIELFHHRLSNELYRIEPKGTKILGSDGKELRTDSIEGQDYMMYDRRGPVGRLTIWRSRLLAVGDHAGALALSISIQEAIDAAKRHPEWTDFRKAANAANWTTRSDGTKECLHRIPKEDLEGLDFPLDMCQAWYKRRIREAGFTNWEESPDNKEVLWWRTLGSDPRQLNLGGASFIPSGDLTGMYENLVHYSTRCVLEEWQHFLGNTANQKGEVHASLLLPMVLAKKGLAINPINKDWSRWIELRKISGLDKYNKDLQRLPNNNNQGDDHQEQQEATEETRVDERMMRVDAAQRELEAKLADQWLSGNMTIDDFVTLWFMELQDPIEGAAPRPNANNAWRAIAWPGSPILELFGLDEGGCRFLHKDNRLRRAVDICMKTDDPFTRMRELMENETLHQKEVRDENGQPVNMYRCEHCMTLLQDRVVSAARNAKTTKEGKFLSNFIKTLRQ